MLFLYTLQSLIHTLLYKASEYLAELRDIKSKQIISALSQIIFYFITNNTELESLQYRLGLSSYLHHILPGIQPERQM